MPVYINDMAICMPNAPVSNDEIEGVLGRVDDQASRSRRLVLKTNGIKSRYYALDGRTGELTHSNAQMAAEAVRKLKPYADFRLEDIQCLCCGTASPDLLFPGHALMVQGELKLPACEAITAAGICISGMIAFKYAYMNIAMGMSTNAVTVGSELSSSFMRSKFFASPNGNGDDPAKRTALPFDTDFLRWMLSDGACAAFLSDRPNADRISLRVDWIDHTAYAGEIDACMYAGGSKQTDGRIVGWRRMGNLDANSLRQAMAVKQDVRLLDEQIIATMKRTLSASIAKHGLKARDINWFLPHYSSDYFREKVFRGLQEIDFEIAYGRWFTNIETMGNTGSASIYIILADLMHSGRLREGDRLLCFIPESGRFSHCFMHLTAVETTGGGG
jgi:3-oxoacyl-[acyl-carrier-protein] synthase III